MESFPSSFQKAVHHSPSNTKRKDAGFRQAEALVLKVPHALTESHHHCDISATHLPLILEDSGVLKFCISNDFESSTPHNWLLSPQIHIFSEENTYPPALLYFLLCKCSSANVLFLQFQSHAFLHLHQAGHLQVYLLMNTLYNHTFLLQSHYTLIFLRMVLSVPANLSFVLLTGKL